MGMYANNHKRFRVTRNISTTVIAPITIPGHVTPHRIGGRVAATNNGSAVTPLFLLATSHPEQAAHPSDDLL